MFVHAGIIHLLLNMWCLWNLGPIAERWFGRAPFLILYFLSGIGGSLASLYMHPATVSVGASGAIFGLAGGLIALLGLRRDSAAAAPVKRFLPSLFTFVAYNLFYGSVTPGIDNAAHVGGLIVGAGFSLALFVGRRRDLP
jgi:rhomboid protease GluP